MKYARQLRLRDLGGIIVVDFIDMKLPENKRKLMEAMEEIYETRQGQACCTSHFQIRTDADHPATDEA